MKHAKPKYDTLSNVVAKPIEWMWEPYIPYGMLTTVEGDPGIGKSFLMMYLAAMVSTGGILPCGQKVKRGRVLLLSAEDDAAYTIRPRIDAMEGKAKRIRFLESYAPFDDVGLKALGSEVEEYNPNVVIIDPLYAFVPGATDIFKPNQIRALLSELNEIAAKSGAALLVLRHLRKTRGENALYQGSGSIDVIAAARSALLVAIDPEDEDARLMMHLKHNLAPQGPTRRYKLKVPKGQALPRLSWRGVSEFTANDYHKGDNPQTVLEAACDFLKDTLSNGPKPHAEIMKIARRRNISKRTIERAKESLNIRPKKVGDHWEWGLKASVSLSNNP